MGPAEADRRKEVLVAKVSCLSGTQVINLSENAMKFVEAKAARHKSVPFS